MIQNIAVGPPVKGLPDALAQNSQSRSSGENRSGAFEKALDEKMSSPTPSKSAPARDQKGDEVGRKKDAKEDRETVAETAKAPAPAAPKKPQTAREKAIQKFMDSFESEFGIPSTRIVEAMASLEPEQVAKAPEETAEAVISELDLDDDSKDRAAEMYAGLLAELQKADAGRPMAQPVATESMLQHPKLSGMQERALMATERRQALNRSLDQLNQKFWMKDASIAKSAIEQSPVQNAQSLKFMDRAVPLDGGFGEELLANEFDLEGISSEMPTAIDERAEDSFRQLDDGEPSLREAPRRDRENGSLIMMAPAVPSEKSADVASAAQRGSKTLSAKEIESLLAQEAKTTPSADGLRKAALAREAGLPAEAMSLKNVDVMKGLEAAPKMESPAFMVPTGFGSGKNSASSNDEQSSGKNGDESAKSAQALMGQGHAQSAKQEFRMESLAPAASAPMGQPTAAEKDPNIRQLMNQAQYLIKKGGGEMKVRMTPEGLGQVQLKVLVQDGKVNVQMAAESNEAKKTIESGLSELKSSLAAHKLGVEHIKVDVVNSANVDTGARNDLNSNSQRDGQQARQFWNNFQENFGNRSQRDGMFEIPGFKNYRQTRQTDPLAPLESSSRTAKAERADGRGSSVDLVA